MAPLLEKEKLLFCSELYNAWAVGGNLTREELRGLAQCFQPDDKAKRLSKKEKKKVTPTSSLLSLLTGAIERSAVALFVLGCFVALLSLS